MSATLHAAMLKTAFFLVFLVTSLTSGFATATPPNVEGVPPMESLYDFTVTDLSGAQRNLGEFRGKVTLVVNTASQCGFTSQYKGLEELHQRFKDRGFSVLAFPSNDFGAQEPGSDAEIKDFCELKYKTTFPIFAKAPVSGPDKQPVYKFITERSATEYRGDPGWNFVKVLVDQEGQVVGRFSSMTTPVSGKIMNAIEELLGTP